MAPFLKNITIEIERSKDCHNSTWHGWFNEKKYDDYESRVRNMVEKLARSERALITVEVNPGPKSLGILCEQDEFNGKLWRSKVMDPNTRRWKKDQTFSYPRIGSFEIFVKKGTQRIEIFSKLKRRLWPNSDWLLAAIEDTVEKKMGGYGTLEDVEEKKTRKFSGVNGRSSVTDEELRELVKKKFSTLAAAFRSFDKNGDGQINRDEFMRGLRQSGVDLPKDQMLRLWQMADEDESGVLHYTEFARKFAAYKATHSLHRHAGHKSEADRKAVALHGVAAGSRMAKTSQERSAQQVAFGVADEHFDESGAKSAKGPQSLSALARTDLSHIAAEDATPDQLRAKIYQRNGNLVNAFRQMDNSGDSRICFEEFKHFIPKVLGEKVSEAKVAELWRTIDEDLSGEIDMAEFASSKLVGSAKATLQGVKTLRDMAVDPTLGQKADHQKNKENYSGLSNDTPAWSHQIGKQLTRPESASTVASVTRPLSAT